MLSLVINIVSNTLKEKWRETILKNTFLFTETSEKIIPSAIFLFEDIVLTE